ncbi:zinc-finger of the MIZ type in Nse subunit-domain-containing protein [Rostrohypoxylon terebratum]|nr:zinc-finger of the MIZ type in Nse subunit-domain-containing protein [Rostrohypoxylon terebratum]
MSSKRRLQTGRPRPSSTTQSTASTSRRQGPTPLPEYEPLSYPLSAPQIRELQALSAGKDARGYAAHLGKSVELLSAAVRDINDRSAERSRALKRLQEKRAETGAEEKNDRERAEEKAVLVLKGEVPALTEACEGAVRDVIDRKVELEDENMAVGATAVKLEDEMRRLGARGVDEVDEVDEEMEGPEGQEWRDTMVLLGRAKEMAKREYDAKSMYEKYGHNNDYIGFKRLWHDAVHGDDGKPLPDASKWFGQNGGEEDEDEDEELVIAGEQLDIHCPLSMAVMQDPYTSSVCKHTFEKNSITQFLMNQPGRRARCPQTGCNKVVTIKDFQPDPVRLRLIKRRLAAERNEDDDDDEGGGEGDTIDADGDTSMRVIQDRVVKKERTEGGRGRRQAEEMDLDEDEEDEEDDDDDDEEA